MPVGGYANLLVVWVEPTVRACMFMKSDGLSVVNENFGGTVRFSSDFVTGAVYARVARVQRQRR